MDAIDLRLENDKAILRGADVEASFGFGSNCSWGHGELSTQVIEEP